MKTIIFDVDGTLIDSLPDILDNSNKTLRKYGKPEIDLKTIKGYVNDGADNLIRSIYGKDLTDEEVNERLKTYIDFYKNSKNDMTRLYDGMDKVLKEFKNRGYKLAILSNKTHVALIPIYNKFFKQYGFDAYQGVEEGMKLKPDTEGIEKIIKALNADKKDVYMIGDGEPDVLTAKNAGVNGIAVLWGYREKTDLKKVGAKTFCSKPIDLLDIIK